MARIRRRRPCIVTLIPGMVYSAPMNARIPAKIARVATLSTTQTAIAVCVLGFALRLFRLDFQPLWGDEGWSFYFASMPVPHMLAKTAVDIHPPFYYALLGAWLKLAGSSPQAARMLSVFFGTLVIALVFAFARFCFGRVAGLCSAFLVAVAPFAVFYSQEVRMYGLVALLGVGSCLLLVVGLGSPSPHRLAWPAYAVVTALALYTLYYAGFLVVAQGLFLAVVWILGRAFPGRAETGRRLRVGLLGLAGAILLYIPWLVFASGKLVTYVQGKRAAEAYLPVGLGEYLRAHFAAFSMGHLPDAFRPLVWGAVAFVVVAGLAVGTLVQEATAGRRWAEIPPSGTPSRRWTWLVLAALLVPLLLGFSVSLLFPFTPPSF